MAFFVQPDRARSPTPRLSGIPTKNEAKSVSSAPHFGRGSLPGLGSDRSVESLFLGIEFVSGAFEESRPVNTKPRLRHAGLIADFLVNSDRGILRSFCHDSSYPLKAQISEVWVLYLTFSKNQRHHIPDIVSLVQLALYPVGVRLPARQIAVFGVASTRGSATDRWEPFTGSPSLDEGDTSSNISWVRKSRVTRVVRL
ncbi:hypothetical protein Huta_0106 [Halorhabdus utahensis DSM 12940]|uniref:Uncharacterized protein n=1 Tax=Halorhabdus utahensis (strain DSM 12940 / JCM 11049 / AX-2) TaxID=519442 RepID=C7NP04_HALUD|nr:hypothetical protein Huta_0106 [Halorhabdus utahensis DSM 12940]